MAKFASFSLPNSSSSIIGKLSDNEQHIIPLVHPHTGNMVKDFFDVLEQWHVFDNNSFSGSHGEMDVNWRHDYLQPRYSLADVKILPPLVGRDVLAVGKNYVDHAKEFNKSGYDSSDTVDIPKFRKLLAIHKNMTY